MFKKSENSFKYTQMNPPSHESGGESILHEATTNHESSGESILHEATTSHESSGESILHEATTSGPLINEQQGDNAEEKNVSHMSRIESEENTATCDASRTISSKPSKYQNSVPESSVPGGATGADEVVNFAGGYEKAPHTSKMPEKCPASTSKNANDITVVIPEQENIKQNIVVNLSSGPSRPKIDSNPTVDRSSQRDNSESSSPYNIILHYKCNDNKCRLHVGSLTSLLINKEPCPIRIRQSSSDFDVNQLTAEDCCSLGNKSRVPESKRTDQDNEGRRAGVSGIGSAVPGGGGSGGCGSSSADLLLECSASSITDTGSQCRICHLSLSETGEPLAASGCLCRGGLSWTHRSCLRHWVRLKGSNTCEVCQGRFTVSPPPSPNTSTLDHMMRETGITWDDINPDETVLQRCMGSHGMFLAIIALLFVLTGSATTLTVMAWRDYADLLNDPFASDLGTANSHLQFILCLVFLILSGVATMVFFAGWVGIELCDRMRYRRRRRILREVGIDVTVT